MVHAVSLQLASASGGKLVNDEQRLQQMTENTFWPDETLLAAKTGQSFYRAATVCRRGHVEDSFLDKRPVRRGNCPTCGARILDACLVCGRRVRGELDVPGVVSFGSGYRPPSFCDACGAAAPWATRNDRLYELENVLDRLEVDEVDELAVRELFDALRAHPEPQQERAVWKEINCRVPRLLFEAKLSLVRGVVPQAVRRELDLENPEAE